MADEIQEYPKALYKPVSARAAAESPGYEMIEVLTPEEEAEKKREGYTESPHQAKG